MAIPVKTKTIHHIGDVYEDIPMSIRSEDFGHIFSLLNNPYSDPLSAVVREYSTNAWDSHVMAGNDRPIEITLPTNDRLEFVVQDFGVGLNLDDLRNVYANYGASDKRHTNDVAGMLGIGSKSGLSYAEGFTVVGIRNHEKVTALVTKDEHGVGVIKPLAPPCATDEPNGVRITIPVDPYDVDEFAEAATNIFQFWEPGTVLIDGEAPEVPQWRATALRLDEWDHTFLVRNDAGLDRSHVIMGNVGYPVPDATVGRSTYRFVARLNIGDVSIPPSREEVQFTPHTKATLADLSDYITATYKRAIATALDNTTSRWEETVLKVLWMDRGATIRAANGDPVWEYTPNGWGHRKARAHPYYRPGALGNPDVIVITGLSAKNLSAPTRLRLREFKPSTDRSQTFVIFPANAPTGMLDGRPNTYTWDEVIGATMTPTVSGPKVKRPKIETRYATLGGADMTGDELAMVTGPVLYLQHYEGATHGTLGATVVRLRASNQIDRIRRFVPGIEPYANEVERRCAAARKAVTALDRQIVTARTLPAHLKKLDPSRIIDPELAAAIVLAKTPDTATMVEASLYGWPVEATASLGDVFNERYPLITAARYYSYDITGKEDDAILYINAKYPSVVTSETA